MKSTDSVKNLHTSVVFQASVGESTLGVPGLLLGADLGGLSQFIDDPEVLTVPGGTTVFVSMRNQLTLVVAQSLLVFRDSSGDTPSREDFPRRVAKVAEHFADVCQIGYDKVGIKFEIEFKRDDGELPSRVLVQRVVKKKVLGEIGYDLIGASGSMWYEARGFLHHLNVGPKGSEVESHEYSADLGVEFELGRMPPSSEWLSRSLKEEYIDFLRVLGQMLNPKEG